MTTKIFVKPARPGMNLRHPVSGALPDTGRSWVDDAFTRRRIAEGGIVQADPKAAEKGAEDHGAAVPAAPSKPAAAAAPAAAKPLPQK